MASTQIPLDFMPSVYRDITQVQAGNKIVDGDKIRFVDGQVASIGGFARQFTSGATIKGVPRRALWWSALDTTIWGAIGTHNHFYALDNTQAYDITPIRRTASLTNAITTVITESIVTIVEVAHGAVVGDFINIPASVTYNGITLLGEYEVLTTPTTGTFTIQASTNASASGTGGGALTVEYLLESGVSDTTTADSGYGTGTWGTTTFGTPRSGVFERRARLWCIQNWGEDILALPSKQGKLYFWDKSVGTSTRLTPVGGTAPVRSNFMLVGSKLRQAILFGTEDATSVFDPMLIRWSDAEDYTNFTISVSTLAGENRLTKGNEIVGAIETGRGEILIFTDTATYLMRPIDTDAIYEIELLSDNVGILAPFAASEVDGIVFWQSFHNYNYYDGAVRILESTLDTPIFKQDGEFKFNELQKAKAFTGRNPAFNEVWFFYQTEPASEIDRYVIFNYKDKVWSDGNLERTCWVDPAIIKYPWALKSDGQLYQHETGITADGSPLLAYATLGQTPINDTNDILLVDQITPDGFFQGPHTIEIKAKKRPLSATTVDKTYTFDPNTEKISVRSKGRYISVTLQATNTGSSFKLGRFYVRGKPDGGR
jgi:hypothetical protein